MSEPKEVTLVNESVPMALNAKNRSGQDVQPLTEDDRTLRTWTPQVYRRASGGNSEVIALAESDGTPKTSQYGQNSGSLVAIGLESTGEQRMVACGKDEASNIDEWRTDPNRIVWVRSFPGYVTVDPISITSSESTLWDPGSTASEQYEVWFKIVNCHTAGVAGVYLGTDIGGGGSLAFPEYVLFNESVPFPGGLPWQFYGIINGDDDIRGVAGTTGVLALHLRVRRTDVGA